MLLVNQLKQYNKLRRHGDAALHSPTPRLIFGLRHVGPADFLRVPVRDLVRLTENVITGLAEIQPVSVVKPGGASRTWVHALGHRQITLDSKPARSRS